MEFWRIYNNKLYSIEHVNQLGFPQSDPSFIPDEYLDNQKFVICRTAHGLGDWGILSAMPRKLKEKYPNSKVYIPNLRLLETIFGNSNDNWKVWGNAYHNALRIFDNNPYIDGFIDSVNGDIFHDHYRIEHVAEEPLLKQILRFWQFNENELIDLQPELYFSKKEIKASKELLGYTLKTDKYCTFLLSCLHCKVNLYSINLPLLSLSMMRYFPQVFS